MHGRKQRRNNHQPPNGSLNYTTHTDYESDTAYLSDMQQSPPLRSNEELNLSVCRRHNPAITSILSLANYAVIYTFSPGSSRWEKINIEGTLFVCELTPGSLGEKRYNAFLLNRRGLENFDCPLTSAENVEITDEYVILKQDKESDAPGLISDPASGPNQINAYVVYGIWIYSEPNTSTAETRDANVKIISECAASAGQSMKEAKARVQAARQDGLQVAAAAAETQVAPTEEVQGGIPMGRTLSLKDLFGQQRAQDDEWSVRAHHEPPTQLPFHPQPPVPQQHLAMQNMPHMQQAPPPFIPVHPHMHSPAMALQQQHFHQQGFQLQQQQFQQQQQLLRQQQAFHQQQQQMQQQYLQQRSGQQGAPQSPPQPQLNPNLLNLFQRAMEPQGPGQ